MANTINMIEQAENQNIVFSRCFPMSGEGKRAMDCKMYDKCLYKAAIGDWESFNCDWCEYEDHGALSFIDSAFRIEFHGLDLTLENDLKNGMVDLFADYTSISSNRYKRTYDGGTFAHWQIALAYAKYLFPRVSSTSRLIVTDHPSDAMKRK